jgi:thiamine-phosphate pyrophosphorylase
VGYDKRNLARDLAVYAVTDSAWLAGRALEDVVAAAIRGGATFVQLREKTCTHEERCALARRVLAVCRAAGVPFVVDDDVACARAVGADGVHVGQSDESCRRARELLGPQAVVGVSAHTPAEALAAQADGADYLGCGAVFPTGTKADAHDVGLAGLAAVCAATSLPVVAIGGVTAANAGELAGMGACGAAVVSAIFAAEDPALAAGQLARAVAGWGSASGGLLGR